MTSQLIPSNPEEVMVIRKVCPEITTLSVPFLRFGKIKIGGRATLVRLQNGTVACFSPVALTPDVRRTLEELGPVKYIAATDNEHHIFMDEWHAAYPDAHIIGPHTLVEKRESQGKPLPWTHLFKPDDDASLKVDAAFDAEFDAEYVHAHTNKELVFNHRPTRTLIEADLMFNLPATEQMSKTGEDPTTGLLTKLFCALNGTAGDARWQRRFIWYATSAADRPSFNRSVARINAWDFERLIPCHGDVLEKDGKTVFQKVMQFHIDAAKK
ncbi:hypothetical protein MBLNU459_g1721t1 [Dothideomycetes sp. NU459]